VPYITGEKIDKERGPILNVVTSKILMQRGTTGANGVTYVAKLTLAFCAIIVGSCVKLKVGCCGNSFVYKIK
jgi:hypothetical protein